MKKVAKFGGTSLADGNQFKKIKLIAEIDKDIYCIIPSAPGKRNNLDVKITDMLYICYKMLSEDIEGGILYFNEIKERFNQIISDLQLNCDLSSEYNYIERQIRNRVTVDYLVSRGEYLSGIILSNYLGYEFIDPYNLIYFDQYGKLDEDITYDNIHKAVDKKRVVIPGFYGRDKNHNVKTFPRGGSDITGAIISKGIHADIYENWTDVSGVFVVDPRLVDNPYARRNISYKELDYLSSMGADVYHKDAIYPVMESNIPIHIRNTNDIHSKGTMIHDNYEYDKAYDIVGIVGRPGYCFFKPNNIYNKLNKKGMFITEKFTAILAENINNDQYEDEYCATLENCMGCNSLLLIVINPTADKSIVYNNIEKKLKEYNESYIMSFADTDNQLLYIGINERIREMLIKEIYYMYYS